MMLQAFLVDVKFGDRTGQHGLVIWRMYFCKIITLRDRALECSKTFSENLVRVAIHAAKCHKITVGLPYDCKSILKATKHRMQWYLILSGQL